MQSVATIMERVETCIGPLLWFPVGDGADYAALVYCEGCGDIFMWMEKVDHKHEHLPVLVG